MRSDDTLVLGIDTSAAHCAAALLSGEDLLGERCEPMRRGQAERLMPMIEELLTADGLAWTDIGAIGVMVGPGNFTGVRIAVAAARGLSLALDAPAIGVNRFEAAAFGSTGAAWITLADPRGATFRQRFLDGVAVTPILPADEDQQPADAPEPCPGLVARIAQARIGAAPGRPAPLYLRAADAATAREAAPALIDDA